MRVRSSRSSSAPWLQEACARRTTKANPRRAKSATPQSGFSSLLPQTLLLSPPSLPLPLTYLLSFPTPPFLLILLLIQKLTFQPRLACNFQRAWFRSLILVVQACAASIVRLLNSVFVPVVALVFSFPDNQQVEHFRMVIEH